MKFNSPFKIKLIYVIRINDRTHLDCLKVGETSIYSKNILDLEPNSRLLNQAAKKRVNGYTQTAGIAYESCCWAFRIAHFKEDNSSGGYNHTTGMELVLNGLGSSTSNLQNKIQKKIPGYSADLR